MVQQLTRTATSRWLFALLSGILMVISFPRTGSLFPLTFIAWVPLLLVEHFYFTIQKSRSFFLQAYLTFFVYNVGTTWWIYNADEAGAYMAFFANSLLMAIAVFIFHRLKMKLGSQWAIPLLLTVWISFEFLHFHWELSWPWLTFGNVFASAPALVQWYSATGVLGGSLWILLTNTVIAQILTTGFQKTWAKSKRMRFLALLIGLPMLISLFQYALKNTNGKPYQVAVLQPNVDPYNTKFSSSNEEQLEELLSLADKTVSLKTKLVLAPETALYPSISIDETGLQQEVFYHQIMERRAKWKNASLLIGASTFQVFDEKVSAASKFNPDFNAFIEHYNTSILFHELRKPGIVHKSKLVLGVEKIPFTGIFPALEDLSIELGGGSGTLGIETEPKILTTNGVSFAPVVCYESIYGGFLSKQSKLGAEFIAIITNDGWWDDTPGYRQHFDFARLRAIENNKYVVRSANTGTSGIINNRGDVLNKTNWWVKTGFRSTIYLNKSKTIYNYLGDFIGYFALVGFTLFLGMRFLKGLHLKKN